ncbi:hypothetical protein BpHYR1_002470 [Brachionus plicatilis]|uniref:Uncharacterized protein n=1 Tax=Brachionus plicatilis TaxID=10195 RepID=A0A3M7SBP0_BRAPC|nr:hypothetical protein BpHYR1_002470 [Brachionus plicatilis]
MLSWKEVKKLNNYLKNAKLKQNKSTNIVEKRIEIGKNVFLKCEGLLNKLEPRFKGPYKVSGHTKSALNETLKDSYPRHKIKLVEDDSSLPVDSAEIERIQKHVTIRYQTTVYNAL